MTDLLHYQSRSQSPRTCVRVANFFTHKGGYMAKTRNLLFFAAIVLFILFTFALSMNTSNVASAIAIYDDPESNGFTMKNFVEIYHTEPSMNEYQMLNFATEYDKIKSRDDYDLYEYVLHIKCNRNFEVVFLHNDDTPLNQSMSVHIKANECVTSIWWCVGDNVESKFDFLKDEPSGDIFLRITNEDIRLASIWNDYYYSHTVEAAFSKFLDKTFEKTTAEYTKLLNFFNDPTTYLYFMVDPDDFTEETTSSITESFSLYSQIPLEIPTKEGHTFLGWFYDEACTIPYDGKPIQSDINLYAGWEVHTFNVYFSEDIDGLVYNCVVDWGQAAACPITPEREGQSFAYWAYEDGTPYTGQPIKEETYLFAVFGDKQLTVSFACLTTDIEVPPVQINYGSGIPLAELPTLYNEGQYALWTLDGGEIYYSGEALYEDTTLYAVWFTRKLTVTFYADSDIYRQVKVDYGTTLLVSLQMAQIEAEQVIDYTFANIETHELPLEEVKVVDDLSVNINKLTDKPQEPQNPQEPNEPKDPQKPSDDKNNTADVTKVFDITLFLEKYGPIFIGIIAALVIALIVVVIIAYKRKK